MKEFDGELGTAIRLIIYKVRKIISNELGNQSNVEKSEVSKVPGILKEKRKIEKINSGILRTSELEILNKVIDLLNSFWHKSLSDLENEILSGSSDTIDISKKNFFQYSRVIGDIIQLLRSNVKTISEYEGKSDFLEEELIVLKAARAGILVNEKTEIVDGKKITYEYTISDNEIKELFDFLNCKKSEVLIEKYIRYIELTINTFSMISPIIKGDKNKKINNMGYMMGILISEIIKTVSFIRNPKEFYEIMRKRNGVIYDLLNQETISDNERVDSLKEIKLLGKKEVTARIKSDIQDKSLDLCIDIFMAIIFGIQINKKVSVKNGKINGKELAEAIIELNKMKLDVIVLIDCIQKFFFIREDTGKFEEKVKKMKEIMKQMDEKVYSLQGVEHRFDSIKIENFCGSFYPRRYGREVNCEVKLYIPEFSIKRGETVLITGNSGVGKSTFLRFLEMGDANNRRKIIVDNEEYVDHLGKQVIFFKPSVELGSENNVLYQITGKESFSSLTKIEIKKLAGIIHELGFNVKETMKKLPYKRIKEFSTGQQKRLALAKVLYKINDKISMIIVDEPIGNVETKLVIGQLKMIEKYAKKANVMLILTTHMNDLAINLATRIYEIDDNGIMHKIPTPKQQQFGE